MKHVTQPRRRTLKIFAILFAALILFSHTTMAQTDTTAGPWSGVIINSGCTADEAFAEAAKCTENTPGAKLVLYDDTTRQMFELDPQTRANGLIGSSVTVHGTLEGATIHVSSLEKLTSIGLNVGQKAPAFSLVDQFGQTQTLQTLKGAHGTILLFFRSADW
jgi:hypothetical protein